MSRPVYNCCNLGCDQIGQYGWDWFRFCHSHARPGTPYIQEKCLLCVKKACFGRTPDGIPRYCFRHAQGAYQTLQKHFNKCQSARCHNIVFTPQHKFCRKHLSNKSAGKRIKTRCFSLGCRKQPAFGITRNSRPLACDLHKILGMDLSQSFCFFCDQPAIAKRINRRSLVRYICAKHVGSHELRPGFKCMLRCCRMDATWNFPNEFPTFCDSHNQVGQQKLLKQELRYFNTLRSFSIPVIIDPGQANTTRVPMVLEPEPELPEIFELPD